jgi:TrmH family RNA methyltransferase
VRDKTGSFLIEGPIAISEALDAGGVVELFASPDPDHEELVERARAVNVHVHSVTEPVVKALSDTQTPQGVVAVGTMNAVTVAELARGADLVLVLAEVRDPGNAGTLVRSAVAAGANGVVFTEKAADPFGPKTVRAAAGALFRTKVSRGALLPEALAALRAEGLTPIGADAGAATTIDEIDLTQPVALVLGNEAWGVPVEMRELLDEVVAIRMPGPVESLNVGIAGSILLFECVRQRGLV